MPAPNYNRMSREQLETEAERLWTENRSLKAVNGKFMINLASKCGIIRNYRLHFSQIGRKCKYIIEHPYGSE